MRLRLLLIALLCAPLVLTGCGDDGSDATDTTDTVDATTESADATDTTTPGADDAFSWADYDTDGDGELSAEEHAKMEEDVPDMGRPRFGHGRGGPFGPGGMGPMGPPMGPPPGGPGMGEVFDTDGDGRMSDEERAKAKEVMDSLRDDAEAKAAREAMREAGDELRDAFRSGDEAAIEEAHAQMKEAAEAFESLVKERLAAAETDEDTDTEEDDSTD